LAVAGGLPTAFPNETPDQQSHLIAVDADQRVKALVLLAPASAWFKAPGALHALHHPILLWTAEHDPYTPPFHAEIIKSGVPDHSLIEHRIVANGSHFAFLSPFPAHLTNPSFPPSQDPPGFDREQFQHELHAGVQAFLERVSPGLK
jgi:predicted dienelactone hydrolase